MHMHVGSAASLHQRWEESIHSGCAFKVDRAAFAGGYAGGLDVGV